MVSAFEFVFVQKTRVKKAKKKQKLKRRRRKAVLFLASIASHTNNTSRTVASAWNAPVSEKNESGVILSDISARRARHVRFARLARALDSERDFPFFSAPSLPKMTQKMESVLF